LFRCPVIYEFWYYAEGYDPFRDAVKFLHDCRFYLSEPCHHIDSLAAMIHTIWTISQMMLYLNVPFGHYAAMGIFEKALKSIKPAKLYNHNEKKGLQREEELYHALQDLISPDKLRTNPFADSSESESESEVPKPVQALPQATNSNSDAKKEDDNFKINIHRKYHLYVNSRIKKYVRVSQKQEPP